MVSIVCKNNPEKEEFDMIKYRYSRSSGPGGQNVNKVNSKVTAYIHVSDLPKGELLLDIASKQGYISVSCQDTRSQSTNKRIATERLLNKIAKCLQPVANGVRCQRHVKREVTVIPTKEKQKRITAKKLNSLKKQSRKPVGIDS